jgi:predicted  nucleic acid-binding Zn-ribbon protein
MDLRELAWDIEALYRENAELRQEIARLRDIEEEYKKLINQNFEHALAMEQVTLNAILQGFYSPQTP